MNNRSCHKLSKINKTKPWTSNGFYNINENAIQYSIKMHECRTNSLFACPFTVKIGLKIYYIGAQVCAYQPLIVPLIFFLR